MVEENIINDMCSTNEIVSDGWFKNIARYKLIYN